MMLLPQLIAIFFLFCQHFGGHTTLAYKILIYSQTLTRSHVILNARVGEALAADGHNVTILEVEYFEPIQEFAGSTAEGVKKITVPGKFFPSDRSEVAKILSSGAFAKQTIWSMVAAFVGDQRFYEEMNAACERFMDQKAELLEQLKAEKFDLFIGEQINFCGSGLSHLLGIPVHVLLVSCPIQEHVASLIGLPFPTSYVPSLYGIPMSDRMTIWERFANWVGSITHGQAFLAGVDHLTGIFRRKFGEQFPSVRDIVKNSPLVFANVDEFVDFPRPLFPNIIYIGGLEYDRPVKGKTTNSTTAQNANKLLPAPFDAEIAKGARGVVFFSMGSAVHTAHVPDQFKLALFAAFAQLKEWHFLVKISEGDLLSKELAAKGAGNVFLTEWAPQKAILAHPRTRLFITHGGYNSLLEAALAGCPVLSIGFFADQRRNGLVPERNGWGMAIQKERLLEEGGAEELAQKARRLMEEDKWANGAKRVAKLMATKPFSARQNLIRYIRFLELNGGQLPELMAESRNMDTIALYNLDLLALVFTAFLMVILITWLLIGCCFRMLKKRRQKSKRE